MNQKLIDILPKKINIHDSSAVYFPAPYIEYNRAIDDCIAALEKAILEGKIMLRTDEYDRKN